MPWASAKMNPFPQKCKFSGANAPSKVQTTGDRQLFCAARGQHMRFVPAATGPLIPQRIGKITFQPVSGPLLQTVGAISNAIGPTVLPGPHPRFYFFCATQLMALRQKCKQAEMQTRARLYPHPLDPRNAAPIGPGIIEIATGGRPERAVAAWFKQAPT